MQLLHATKIKPVEVNINFHTPWKHQNVAFRDIKGNTDEMGSTTWHRPEQHSLMLLVWNASSSMIKQNRCKNKIIWLTQTVLFKSFYLFHINYIEDIKEYFFLQNLFYIKRFRWKIVFKISKNVELKIANDPKIV